MKKSAVKNAGLASIAAAILALGATVFVTGGIVLRQKFFHRNVDEKSGAIEAQMKADAPAPKTVKTPGFQNKTLFERLIVTRPQEGDVISGDTVTLEGSAWGWFEGNVPVEVFDGNGVKLYAYPLTVYENYERPAYFYKEIKLSVQPMTSTGTIVFTDYSAKDGSMTFRKKIQIGFEGSVRNIKLFYYNKLNDPEVMCEPESVSPVFRTIPMTNTPIQDAVKLLLEGKLSEEEKLQGFQTEFPLEGFGLEGANLKNGILTLEFQDLMDRASGGSCRANILRSQVSHTAAQFPEVKEVRFLPETLFQP